MSPDLSIIIVTFNNKDLLESCLNSLFENVSNTISYEIFVVDNNSQDSTLQLLQEKFPSVKVIDNKENLGFAKANNQAMRNARGRYFLLLNNDTFVLQDSLEKMVKFMDQNKNIGALSPRLLEADGKTIQLQGSSLQKKIWLSTKPLPVKFISGAAFLIRAQAYQNIGGLDEKFFFYNEDLDWCYRLHKNGWDIYYFPESSVIHYGGKSSRLIKKQTFVEGFKGGLYFCYKHYRPLLPFYLMLLFIYILLALILTIFQIILFKNKKNYIEKLKAFAEILFLICTGKYK